MHLIQSSVGHPIRVSHMSHSRGGRELNFFSGRYALPRFPNLGACEWINCYVSGGLSRFSLKNSDFRTDILQNFQAFLMKNAVKFEFLKLKIVIFSKQVLLWRENVKFFFQMRVL